MEVVLVELSHETRHVAVLEVLREDRAGELLILHGASENSGLFHTAAPSRGKEKYLYNDKGVAIFPPSCHILMRRVLEHSRERQQRPGRSPANQHTDTACEPGRELDIPSRSTKSAAKLTNSLALLPPVPAVVAAISPPDMATEGSPMRNTLLSVAKTGFSQSRL